MNPTLFYNNNPTLKHPAWDTDSHYKLLAQKKIFKTKRSYERWVEKEDFLPRNLNLENYKDALGDRLNSLIQFYLFKTLKVKIINSFLLMTEEKDGFG